MFLLVAIARNIIINRFKLLLRTDTQKRLIVVITDYFYVCYKVNTKYEETLIYTYCHYDF